ncbi:uncharacterized protein LOC115452124 isoform X2 [Manduca sexta]|uniref:uncharacterized protein LOC115452124 isoform X2 n=1 Tax=Manduca sexta TaxID=7130 RepID=UPI0018909ABA|nr:uncharacterized protein LOC115452124 isoform X2 [Manduca sexta]
MRSIVLISAFCCQLVWCYGLPGAQQVGAFAYQDSAGHRYGGTYGLKDGKIVEAEGNFPPNFQVNNFHEWDYFAPEYFKNLENLLQEFPGFMEFPDFGAFPGPSAFPTPHFNNGNDYSAFASAAAIPGVNRQVAAINPENPAVPNVDTVNRYADSRSAPGAGNFMSVSSSSYSSSSNVNGEVKNSRGAETVVNDNGRVTRYKVQS